MLGQEWLALETLSDTHSFFLSWHWIGAWLRCLPSDIEPIILRILSNSQTVGLALLVRATTPVLKILKLSQLVLNATGQSELDKIAIEYNGFLAARGLEQAVADAALDWLLQQGVPNQAFLLDGINSDLSELANLAALRNRRLVVQTNYSPAPYVDLAMVRSSGTDYLNHLSRNSRQSLRRSLRYYEATGPLHYHVARSCDEALEMLDDLETMHQRYWQAQGMPGAFAQPHFKQFHTELIKTAFEDNHIEIAQISVDKQPIGYLYNFVWHNTLYAYQSGFHYTEEKQARPGYVSHYSAILFSLSKGRAIYDFMAGDRQHKTSLSTGCHHLHWQQLRTPTLSVRLEKYLKGLLIAHRSH